MKILLLGKNGQVGWELQRSLAPLGELIALDRHSTDLCGDLADLDGISDTVRQVRPDVIVNAAAYTAVDKAESEPVLARTLNVLAPGVLAQEAARLGAWLVHYSTDYVFDGSGSIPWKETDTPAPLSVYGETKLEGDRLVATNCTSYLIFRTSWLYSARGDNFAKTILRLAGERGRLTVVDDQVGAPTGADLVADVTAHAIRCALQQSGLAGLYHLAASGHISWHGYAQFLISRASDKGMLFQAQLDSIEAVPSDDFPGAALRPQNSRLDTTKIKSAFGVVLPNWQKGVERLLAEMP